MEAVNDARELARRALRGYQNLNERDLAHAILSLCDVIDPDVPGYSVDLELLERAGSR